MADPQDVQVPPPKGSGLLGRGTPPQPIPQAWAPQPMPPRNDFGQLVRQGFGLGIGIWLAFFTIGAIVWIPLVVLAVLSAAA